MVLKGRGKKAKKRRSRAVGSGSVAFDSRVFAGDVSLIIHASRRPRFPSSVRG